MINNLHLSLVEGIFTPFHFLFYFSSNPTFGTLFCLIYLSIFPIALSIVVILSILCAKLIQTLSPLPPIPPTPYISPSPLSRHSVQNTDTRVLTTAILHPIFTLFTTFAKLFNIFNSYRRHNNILHLYPFSQCFARKIIYTDIVINVLNCQYVVIILAIHFIYINERSYFGCVILDDYTPYFNGFWRTYLPLKTFDVEDDIYLLAAVGTRYCIGVIKQIDHPTTDCGSNLFQLA